MDSLTNTITSETQRSQRGEGRNQVVFWLQRSQMFIENCVSMTRAPAERNVSGNGTQFRFAPLERGGLLGSRVLKTLRPYGTGNLD